MAAVFFLSPRVGEDNKLSIYNEKNIAFDCAGIMYPVPCGGAGAAFG